MNTNATSAEVALMQKGKNEKLYVVAVHLLTRVMFCSLCAYDNG